ncbi:OsmC/Ohr family protein [Paucilactobacillus hokkaidonensis JCM 18461]|uniref:OsmC/Ohr family protein n=2 Tax=Paucilactobacillus hokkaidonensis TaxID=1193095 RepID=A0A0A1H0A8_9LACO|nr:organic hydroperoxide resistance protein [Paucilactobacillus hokkaidonensis]KRO09451.1 organic hydroperoxide resistance protein [Paucilactobacillus hokkaidonensis]BAP86699.1 OsmC/Ohr family protein [Paucilactobacillus hokkaidonensis JCM 18461]
MAQKLYSNKMINRGGREGEVHSPDGKLDLQITSPGKGGTNPEELFAAGYASCFNSALEVVLKEAQIDGDHFISAEVTLYSQGPADFHIGVELTGHIEGVSEEEQQHLLESADKVCPYSKAIRGNVEVELTVDDGLKY